MQEVWKDVCGYEGVYEVSNLGNVRSIDRIDCLGHIRKGKVLNIVTDKYGYFVVHLSLFGKSKYHKVHRLVALAFIENPQNFRQINHKDENKKNNCVSNLEWCTSKHNINYGNRNNLVAISLYGENGHRHKLTQKDVDEIRTLYKKRSKENNMKKLSLKYGVSETEIRRIIKNQRWKIHKEDQ